MTSVELGSEMTYSYPKVTPIMPMSKAKNISSFLKPYLSRNRNVNVSMMVIRQPPHKGILKNKHFVKNLVNSSNRYSNVTYWPSIKININVIRHVNILISHSE